MWHLNKLLLTYLLTIITDYNLLHNPVILNSSQIKPNDSGNKQWRCNEMTACFSLFAYYHNNVIFFFFFSFIV